MKREMNQFNATVDAKLTVTPPTPKPSKRRIIKTSLQNEYVRSLILNEDVEFRIQRGVKTSFDCREAEKN